MAENPKPTRLTGGDGFNFEDKVAAFFLSSMLAGSYPCGIDFGAVSRIDWQVGGAGWQLDDLLLTSASPTATHLSISVKSDRQVTRSGFPRSFVNAVLNQEEATTPDGIPHKDNILYCLAVGQLASSVHEAWHTLLKDARLGSPESITSRYTNKGGSNAVSRALFCSLTTKGQAPNTDTSRLVKRTRLMHFDFFDHESRREVDSFELCQRALAPIQADKAIDLWHDLIRIAAERRGAGGFLDIEGLVAEIRPKYSLRDRPDHSSDWSILDRRSAELASAITDSIGGRVSLIRRDLINKLSANVHDNRSLLIAGDGGAGKSSVAKRLAQSSGLFDRFLWLDAASLDFNLLADVDRNLGISTPLETLLSTSTTSRSCLVIDGLEVSQLDQSGVLCFFECKAIIGTRLQSTFATQIGFLYPLTVCLCT